MKVAYEALSGFAFSMAKCLASGLGPRKCLELSAGAVRSPELQRAAAAAAQSADTGGALSDGFDSCAGFFPGFFIPVVRAGELGGRQVEAYELIHEHCQRLRPALVLLRNSWLYPLVCIVAGWGIRTVMFVSFGLYQFAWQFVRDTFLRSAILVLIGWSLMQLRPVRESADTLLLQLPLIRETLIRLSVVLFLSTFRLACETGGLHVLTVFDLALATVPNAAIRKDFATARPVLAEGGGFEDAFNQPRLLEDRIKSSIAVGALSGDLPRLLEHITKGETVALEMSLARFNAVFQRLVAYAVAISIVGTVLICVTYRSGK